MGRCVGQALWRTHLELIESKQGVVREQGRQLVQAHQDHKGHRVPLRCQGDQGVAAGRHDAAVGQQRLRAQHHLQARARASATTAAGLPAASGRLSGACLDVGTCCCCWHGVKLAGPCCSGPSTLFTRAMSAKMAESAMAVVLMPAAASWAAMVWPPCVGEPSATTTCAPPAASSALLQPACEPGYGMRHGWRPPDLRFLHDGGTTAPGRTWKSRFLAASLRKSSTVWEKPAVRMTSFACMCSEACRHERLELQQQTRPQVLKGTGQQVVQ